MRRPTYRAGMFLLRFLLLAVLFEAAFFLIFADRPAFGWYLQLNARAVGGLLSLFGCANEISGATISIGASSFEVARGCDVTRPVGLLISAILAFPAPLSSKALAIAKGVALLLSVNLLRILSLIGASILVPSLYNDLHLAFWPMLLILMMLWFWTAWARRAVQA